jgi:hypothetical protein
MKNGGIHSLGQLLNTISFLNETRKLIEFTSDFRSILTGVCSFLRNSIFEEVIEINRTGKSIGLTKKYIENRNRHTRFIYHM